MICNYRVEKLAAEKQFWDEGGVCYELDGSGVLDNSF